MIFNKGFTLAEIMVVISIVSVIMTTVLFSYSTFSDRLAISSAAQEIAITIRQAQTYGLTVREAATAGGDFTAPYGMYFNTADPTHYQLYVDKNKNNRYDVGAGCGTAGTECVEQGTIRNGVTISNICNSSLCPPTNATGLYVSYTRPNPDASIYFVNSSDATLSSDVTGKIVLTSPKGNTTTLIIESTGQVTVQ